MQVAKLILVLMLLTSYVQSTYAQGLKTGDSTKNNLFFNNTEFVRTDSGLIIKQYYRDACKAQFLSSFFIGDSVKALAVKEVVYKETVKPKFITVHGNVLYNFFYRSQIDTPFAENNVMQHLVQTNLNILIKEKYPIRLTLSNRNSNSAYFKNATDINLQFNRSQMLEHIKNNLRDRATSLVNTGELGIAEKKIKEKLAEADEVKTWLNNPARAQELVEEKERQLRNGADNFKMPDTESLPKAGKEKWPAVFGNGIESKFLKQRFSNAVKEKLEEKANKYLANDSSITKKYNAQKEKLAKLENETKQYTSKTNLLKKNMQDSVNKIKREISGLKSGSGLYAFMKKNGISKKELTGGQRLLLSVNQIGVGRTWVDYSELTVKNISLGGVNIEMNPAPYYFAFAAGKVNYRFRDFILKGNKAFSDQSLYLFRAGLGQKEKNNLIFTFYNGRKSVLNYTGSNNAASVQHLLGVSAETRLALNENNYIIAEIAKSSFQNAGQRPASSELIDKAFNWKIRSNEAYCIKLFSQNPKTDTKITAFYKKTGEHFQSFNLYPTNVNFDSYMLRVNQYLWKRKISIDGAIRKNDFVSPIAAPSFSSKTIFKSVQASVRIKKYPFVSLGYYPSSQLSLSNNNLLVENQYNTLNAVMSYSYQVKKTGMNTNAVFTKFYNSSSDTGFVYFNASSYTINQSFYFSPFMIQGSVSMTEQKDLRLLTIEPLLSYQYKNVITVSGSLKWNRLNNTETLFGGTGAINFYLKKFGTIQLNYDKTYIPGYNRDLKPVDIGRASFFREF